MDRSDIEKQIVAASNQIRWRANLDCYEDTALDGFIMAWYDLLTYYENNNDSQISIEVIREYVHHSEAWESIANDDQVPPECREMVYDAYTALEWHMHEIIKVVTRWLYPDGRSRD